MAKKFLVAVDLVKNELQNARIQNLAAAPGSPVEGQIYQDTVTHAAYIWNGSAWRPCDAAKLTDGTIANTALATNPLARGNHTGTQLAATISDFNTAVRLNTLNQMATPTADVAMGNFKLTGLGTPTANTDAANKQYVDDKAAGLSWKDEVRVATTVAGTLASSFANGSTVDGVTLITGDRILIKDQAAGAENGIYTVNASGAPTRATDADTAADIAGAVMCTMFGTTNAGVRFILTTSGTITLGTTALAFGVFGGGTSYTAGNGLQLATTTFSVKLPANSGLVADGTGTYIDTSVVSRKYATSFGNGALTTFTITHNLNTLDVVAQVYTVADGSEVECDILRATVNTLTINTAVAPTTNQYRVVVNG